MIGERARLSGALSRLRAQMALLTPAQQRAAAYTLEHPREVVYQTVTELAEASGTGVATVMRLCRDIGFGGFQEFKLALAADLAGAPSSPDALPSGTPESLIAQAARACAQALEETGKVLDPRELERALNALAHAPFILLTGQGASGVTALDFAYKLLRLGLNAAATVDPHLAAMRAAVLPRGSVTVGITRSGSTIDTVHVLREARQSGAFVVAITHRARSPVTEYADCTLHTASPEDPLGGGAVASKVGQLLVLEALYTGLATRVPGAQDAVRTTAAAVVDKSY